MLFRPQNERVLITCREWTGVGGNYKAEHSLVFTLVIPPSLCGWGGGLRHVGIDPPCYRERHQALLGSQRPRPELLPEMRVSQEPQLYNQELLVGIQE